jgi:hypothetical protein
MKLSGKILVAMLGVLFSTQGNLALADPYHQCLAGCTKKMDECLKPLREHPFRPINECRLEAEQRDQGRVQGCLRLPRTLIVPSPFAVWFPRAECLAASQSQLLKDYEQCLGKGVGECHKNLKVCLAGDGTPQNLGCNRFLAAINDDYSDDLSGESEIPDEEQDFSESEK